MAYDAATMSKKKIGTASSNALSSYQALWNEFQMRQGLKRTRQRDKIVSIFFGMAEHVSVDDLLVRVRQEAPQVGYATVYRTLKLLHDAGLATEHRFGNEQTRYEPAGPHKPHHDHLICMRCSLILEFENHEIEHLQDNIASRLGQFQIIDHKLELYGLCPKAQGFQGKPCPGEERGLISFP